MLFTNHKIGQYIVLFLICFIIIGFVSPIAYADDGEEKQGFLANTLGGFFKFLSTNLYKPLIKANIDVDELVFNQGEGPLTGLTLFKPGETQNFLAIFYNVFNYIAMMIFVPIALWGGYGISKGGESPQAKSMMKERLNKLVLTLIFLYLMPQLLTILIQISNAFVQIFASLAGGTGNLIESYIMLDEGYTVVDAIISLVLVGVNIWMVSFYIIRDLTVAFLFLLFPIIAIWHPFSKNMVANWAKNMLGNVFAQPIQALVLSLILTMAKTLPVDSFATALYLLIAFGSIIPMTGIIKSFLGLETGVGAASSKAGIGGAMGAMMLMRTMGRSGMRQTDGVKDKVSDAINVKKENKIKETEMDKNLDISSSESLNRDLGNPNRTSDNKESFDTTTDEGKRQAKESMRRENRAASKEAWGAVGKAVGGTALKVVGGATLGMAGAAIGAGGGGGWSSQSARSLGTMGAVGGVLAGGVAGKGVGSAVKTGRDEYLGYKENQRMESEIRDIQLDEVLSSKRANDPSFTREDAEGLIDSNSSNYDEELYNSTRISAENKYLGIDGENLDGTEWQTQQREALMAKKVIQNRGVVSNTFGHAKSKASEFKSMEKTTGNLKDFAKNVDPLAPLNPEMQARQKFAEMTPAKKTPQELAKIDNARLYQDKKRTIAYVPGENGELEILSVGAGNPYLEQPIESGVSFNPNTVGGAADRDFEINSMATEKAHNYIMDTHPEITDMSSPEYKDLFKERANTYRREMSYKQEANFEGIKSELGVQSINLKTDNARLDDLMAREKIKEAWRQAEVRQRKVALLEEETKKKTYQPYSRDNSGSPKVSVDNLI